jgi:AcrR family transcriptional regulator
MSGTPSDTRAAPTAPATRRVSAAERRAQFLEVTAEIVREHGADAVSMESVAAAANVNKVILYRQFSNRAELLLTLFEQETAELDGRVAAAMDAVDGFEGKVRAWVHAWFVYMGRNGTLYYRLVDAARTLASGSAAAPHRERQRRLIKQHGLWYAETFGIPVDQGFDTAAILYAGLTGAIDRWVGAPTAATRRRLEETYAHVVLGGLASMASAPREPAVHDEKTNGGANGRRRSSTKNGSKGRNGR